MIRRSFLTLVAALSTVVLAACDDATGTGGNTELSLFLTDFPGEVLSAVVHIERIELVGEGEGVLEVGAPDEDFDLIELQDDPAILAAPVTVPSGFYSQLRLIVTDACLVVDGEEGAPDAIYTSSEAYRAQCEAEGRQPAGDLIRPSLAETGIKVNLPGGTLELEGEEKNLILDWNVAESFGQQAGQSGRWVMHPVINAEDAGLTATLTVTLSPGTELDLTAVSGASLDDFEAVLNPSSVAPQAVAFADVNGTWTATFTNLVYGDYEVFVQLEDETDYPFTVDPATPVMLEVLSGQDVGPQNFVLEAVGPS